MFLCPPSIVSDDPPSFQVWLVVDQSQHKHRPKDLIQNFPLYSSCPPSIGSTIINSGIGLTKSNLMKNLETIAILLDMVLCFHLCQQGLIWFYHPDKSIQTITLLKYPTIPVARELCKDH